MARAAVFEIGRFQTELVTRRSFARISENQPRTACTALQTMASFQNAKNYRGEEYWYQGAGWQVLWKQVNRLALQEVDLLRSDLQGVPADNAGPFFDMMDRVVDGIGSRAPNTTEMWAMALALLGDKEGFVSHLRRDRQKLIAPPPDLTDSQIFTNAFRRGLEEARRKASPISEHRLKTWESLKRISDELVRERQWSDKDRQDWKHLSALLEKIRTDPVYSKSKNIPRTYETIESYFLEFWAPKTPLWDEPESSDQPLHADDKREISSLVDGYSDHEASDLRELFDEYAIHQRLHHCIEGLKQFDNDLAETIDIAYKLGPARWLTSGAFRTAKNITKREYSRRIDAGLKLLLDCLEDKIPKILGDAVASQELMS